MQTRQRSSTMARALIIMSLGLAAAMAAQAADIGLSTEQPGNLFAAGSAVVVQVKAAGPTCLWQVMDFDGAKVAEGNVSLTDGAGQTQVPALPYGYYEFSCQCGEAKGKMSFGVVTDHSGQAPPAGRVNVDAAAAWLTKPEQFQNVAKMLRMMGIGWVRERFSWGATEPEKGKVDWRQYDAIADAHSGQGVRVYQIFHDSPGWTRPNAKTPNPDDLRDVYRFAQRIGTHYKGKVSAWEIWNEPDIAFWPDLSDSYAGVLKAAYLGLKSSDPAAPVLMGSFCRGLSEFDSGVLDSGAADYFDVFNWHCYSPPADYAPTLAKYLELLKAHGCDKRPVWLTECGIALRATEPDGELNAADERKQAEFLPRSVASSLAAGTDRHFFFVFPYYLENGVQFGALHRDLSPRPVCLALATAVEWLGQAQYLGRLTLPQAADAMALAFRTGDQRMLVAWSDKPKEVTLPVGVTQVTVADAVGKRTIVQAPGGKLTLTLKPAPQYVVGLGEAAVAGAVGPVRPLGQMPQNKPCPVIVRGQVRGLKTDKSHDDYLVGTEPFTYSVDAYDLTSDRPAQGTLTVQAPAGWKIEPRTVEVKLAAMERGVFDFKVTPGPATREALRVSVTPQFDAFSPAPSVSQMRFDYAQVPPVETRDLQLNDAKRWIANISGNGTMEITSAGENPRFIAHFAKPGDRWFYPKAVFEQPQDYSKFQGIAFEYRCHPANAKTSARLQLIEAGGSSYLTDPLPSSEEWTPVVVQFADLSWGSFSAVDPDGKFDPQAIGTLMVGGNTPEDEMWLEVRNLRLVRW